MIAITQLFRVWKDICRKQRRYTILLTYTWTSCCGDADKTGLAFLISGVAIQ